MQPYANNSGKSNILAYYIGDDFIVVQFPHNAYCKCIGQPAIEMMKRFAQSGPSLASVL